MNAPQGQAPRKKVHILVKLFVALHVFGITVWSLPNPRDPIRFGAIEPYGTDWILYYNWLYVKQSPIRYYLISGGTWQYWDMFSANPSSIDVWGDAEVEYRDGTVRRYGYPRMYALPIYKKYFKERFRKYFERAGADESPYLWPPLAARIARDMDRFPGNPPVKVRLIRYSQKLDHRKPIPKDYERRVYYEQLVEPNDLDGAEGAR
jgi:hypothetical protein